MKGNKIGQIKNNKKKCKKIQCNKNTIMYKHTKNKNKILENVSLEFIDKEEIVYYNTSMSVTVNKNMLLHKP